MTADPVDGIVQEFLIEADDDWIGLWQIPRQLRRRVSGADDAEVRRLGEQVIRGLVAAGLQIGRLVPGRGFVSWPDGSDVGRLLARWDELDRDPDMDEDIWFGFPGRD